MAEKMRLQKYLSACGVASRRKSEEMIEAGRVRVNNRTVKLGDSMDPKTDVVTLDGEVVSMGQEKLYLAFYKPRGLVSTMSDEQGRRCVGDLTAELGARVYPVGRLDRNSEGLLILTNDGSFANLVMHPAKQIAKTYRVTVRPRVNEDQLNRISTGIVIDGRKTAPAKVKVLAEEDNRAVLEIVLYEGRNREIRKMCEALGLEVARLKRIAEGPVRLGMLRQGEVRPLTGEEMEGFQSQSRKKQQKSHQERRAPGQSRSSGQSGSSEGSGKRRKSGEAWSTGSSSRSGQSGRFGGTGKTDRSGSPRQSGKTGRPGQTAKPGKLSKPRKPTRGEGRK